ncbi:MAG: hypothetical protein PSV16_04125 [Flavobacterium sp.]|nr:hypothetical protein [Flavobacterium sp.]
MTEKYFLKIRIYFLSIITIANCSLLIWDYFHGGVPSHHLLQREDLPAFSNWLGGILIPLLVWFLLYRIQKRISNSSGISKDTINLLSAFLGALGFGILLSIFFTLGNTEIPFYLVVSLLFLALFLPIYRAEYFLGFVTGMIFTFGGILPIGIIAIISLIGAVLYRIVRPGIRYLTSKITSLATSKKNNSGNL